MTVLQAVALIVVALGGLAVTLVPDPLRQTFVLGIYGLALMFLFFVLQAPDVALSEIVVGTVGLPLIVIVALRKIAEQERSKARSEEDE
jgi:energy-converting hydrogenase B subunit D